METEVKARFEQSSNYAFYKNKKRLEWSIVRFGVCYDLTKAEFIARLGYDYIEGHVTKIAAMSDEEFKALEAQINSLPIKVEACCVLFPGNLKVVGPDADLDAVSKYLDTVFPRLERLGVGPVVFGSGGARKVPEGFDRALAWHQMIEVGRLLSEKAGKHNLTIVIEPLNKNETNIINYQLDALKLAKDIERDNVRVLSDFYHLSLGGEGRAEVAACGKLLKHAHIANPKGRISPARGDEISYDGFFAGLADVGYSGRLSVECSLKEPEKELAESLILLKEKAAEYGI
jgi:sugar phosphate isomerase/epimerase